MRDTGMERLRTAVIGAGKMGAIHARLYSEIPESRLVAVVDTDAPRARALAERYGCVAASDPADIIDQVDAVTLASPTCTHLALARPFLNRRIPMLIEKPLAADSKQGRAIVALAGRQGTVVAVGHSERCNPVFLAIRGGVGRPRFMEAVRVSPYPFRSLDVGVVLDVMIHDIDIAISLAQAPIRRIEAVGATVIGPFEDLCKARITFADGCIADLTASRVALETQREFRLFTDQGYFNLDYLRKTAMKVSAEANRQVVDQVRGAMAGHGDLGPSPWQDRVRKESPSIGQAEPLRIEQEAFLRAVLDRSLRPVVTAEEGLAALVCAERITRCVARAPLNPYP